MPDTLTMPPFAPAAGEEPALYVCVWDHVARYVAWLDAANGRGPHETATRILKITEEAGKAAAAYAGVTGANPRKGVTATPADLAGELCDVTLAALVALATVTGGTRKPNPRWPVTSPPAPSGSAPCGPPRDRHPAGAPASPPMRAREFGELAGAVAAACGRYGVPAWSEEDRERLEAALWRFIHPDLAHSPADPYHNPDDDEPGGHRS